MASAGSRRNTVRRTTPRAFHVMIKPRGPICNLSCAYCYYLPKRRLYPDGDFRMSDELLERFTRQYIEAQGVREVIFGWQGGEPLLMGLDFFRRALALQETYRRPGMRIVNTLQTNGVLLDDDWCRFFKQHDVLVGLSLDGPRALHDAYRVDPRGRGTFHRVMDGLALLKRHQVEFNVLTCVHAVNAARPLDVYRFLRDEAGARFVQFIPVIERDDGIGLPQGRGGPGRAGPGRSVSGSQYGRFLMDIFDEWVARDVGEVFVQIFDAALAAWLGRPAGLCVFEETCGRAMALEHNGDVYACDHFVDRRHKLGNIRETHLAVLAGSRSQRRFGRIKRDELPGSCGTCDVRFVCNGGCPKNRLLPAGDGEPGLNHLCEGYRAFFRHIDRPMRMMAAALRMGKPATVVMGILAEEKSREAHNDPEEARA